jgi:membrane protease subunit HflC
VRRTLLLIVAGVFVLALLARAMTYTVRFTEAAVLTTFGSADAGAKRDQPGLKFKWPDPIQSVTKYDTRTRFLQLRSETQQTADSRLLAVEAFATWRVSDPLTFFKKFSSAGPSASDHYRRAEKIIQDGLRASMGEVSKYRMGDLFTAEANGSKLPELEGGMLAALKRSGDRGGDLSGWGIEVTGVGINRIVLPEDTNKEVVNSMKAGRNVLIKNLESQGEADEKRITSTAQANARRIENFAREYAEEIRRKGNEEAAQYITPMNEAVELAILLKNAEFIRNVMTKRTTFVIDSSMPGFEFASMRSASEAAQGKVPGAEKLRGDPSETAARKLNGTDSEKKDVDKRPEGSR